MDEKQLQHVLSFTYLEFVLGDSGIDGVECYRKEAGLISSLVNAKFVT